MHITISKHCKEQMRKRGVRESEIFDTVRQGNWTPTKYRRYEAEKEYPFNAVWNNKFYQYKKVNPVFVKEYETVTVVTVYAFYY